MDQANLTLDVKFEVLRAKCSAVPRSEWSLLSRMETLSKRQVLRCPVDLIVPAHRQATSLSSRSLFSVLFAGFVGESQDPLTIKSVRREVLPCLCCGRTPHSLLAHRLLCCTAAQMQSTLTETGLITLQEQHGRPHLQFVLL